MEHNQPQVGVGVMILKDGAVLLVNAKVPMGQGSMPSRADRLRVSLDGPLDDVDDIRVRDDHAFRSAGRLP